METAEKEMSGLLLKFRKRLLRSIAIKMLEHGVPARIVRSVTGCTQSWIYAKRKEIIQARHGH